MRDKSKLIAFLLSAVPGLAHLYIGLKERALIFFMIFGAIFTGGVGLSILSHDDSFLLLAILVYPIIWLIALVDMFSAWRKLELWEVYDNDEGYDLVDSRINKKTITLALSVVPGAGHMYLGYQTKGLLIMAAFFFSIFFMGLLGISLLLFLLPLIWFYSFFDALQLVDGTKEAKDEDIELSKIKPEWVGTGLIAIGLIIIVERILFPLVPYQLRNYIQTSIVSLIFIILGIVILSKNKKALDNGGVDENKDQLDGKDEVGE